MGIFRIARAEFIKIFKKPSVYLMGVILASVLVLSLLFFQPIGKQSYNVSINGTNVGQIYNKFIDDTDTTTGDNKLSKYNATIDENLTKINYYKAINGYMSNLQKVNGEFIVLYNDLGTQLLIKNNDTKINAAYTSLKNKLTEYATAYSNTSTITKNSEFFNKFTQFGIYTESLDVLNTLSANATNLDPQSFYNIIKSNNHIDKLNTAISNINNYVKTTLNNLTKTILTNQTNYYNKVINTTIDETAFNNLKNTLRASVSDYKTLLGDLLSEKYPMNFVEKEQYDEIDKLITTVFDVIDSFDNEENANKTPHKKHSDIVKKLNDISLPNKLTAFNNSIVNYQISVPKLNDLEKIINSSVKDCKDGLIKSMESLNKSSAVSDSTENMKSMNQLITNYRVLSINTTTLVSNTINLDVTNHINSNEINKYIGFDKFNIYEKNEELTKVKYLILNSAYNEDFNDVFAFNKNSGAKTNAYDFMYYAMEIATIIITVFAIFLAASLMASEYDSGTIKLLAMRPYKRWKIITGKLIATMTFVLIFVLFSSIITYVAGICLYPVDNTPILAIFNSSTAISFNPIILMLINIASILLEIFFYTVIALSISTMFRSYTGAISVSCIMFIMALSLNLLFGGAYWYSFIPFINADLFKYLGGSFLVTQSGALNQLFTPTLLSNSNFFISLSIYGITVVTFLIINYIVFKVKDF